MALALIDPHLWFLRHFGYSHPASGIGQSFLFRRHEEKNGKRKEERVIAGSAITDNDKFSVISRLCWCLARIVPSPRGASVWPWPSIVYHPVARCTWLPYLTYLTRADPPLSYSAAVPFSTSQNSTARRGIWKVGNLDVVDIWSRDLVFTNGGFFEWVPKSAKWNCMAGT